MKDVSEICEPTLVLHQHDTVGRAAEALRSASVRALPVVSSGVLLGLLAEEDLVTYLAENPGVDPEQALVAELDLRTAVPLAPDASAAHALYLFRERNLTAAPVVDYDGRVLGLVGGGEVASAVCGRVRPPMIGGMATPLGVYLTCGSARGGVGDLALVGTGFFLGMLHLCSVLAAWWLVFGWNGLMQLPGADRWADDWAASVFVLLSVLFYGVLLRLSWVAGYHAAEHQVVHAVERCADLRAETVSQMPRVHPRCGTNLVAAILLMTIGVEMILSLQESARMDLGGVLTPMVATFLLWKRVGGWLQQHVTTRRASPRQIESGIAAARQLMVNYQGSPGGRHTRLRRIWNMGIVQVAFGLGVALGLAKLLQISPLPLPDFFRQIPL